MPEIDHGALTQRLHWIAEFMEDHGIGMGDECDAPTLIEAAQEIERLVHLKADECLAMLEKVAAAGARLTRLAGGGEAPNGGLQFASKDGMFSEEIAHQRIRWLLRCEKAVKSMAAQICSPATTPEQMADDILGEKTDTRRRATR